MQPPENLLQNDDSDIGLIIRSADLRFRPRQRCRAFSLRRGNGNIILFPVPQRIMNHARRPRLHHHFIAGVDSGMIEWRSRQPADQIVAALCIVKQQNVAGLRRSRLRFRRYHAVSEIFALPPPLPCQRITDDSARRQHSCGEAHRLAFE